MSSPEDYYLKHFDVPYDPIKAREYYLRTRKLKGRQKGAQANSSLSRAAAAISRVAKQRAALPVVSPAQKKKNAAVETAKLNLRLKALNKVLAELVKEAKVRSGVDPVKEAAQVKEQKAIADSKLSPSEKTQKAKDAKERYDKQKKTPDPDAKAVQEKIDAVAKKITEMRAEIQALKEENAAKAKANRSSSSVGVRANPNK